MIIISLISGLLSPVAVSSSSHFAFMDSIMSVTESREESVLYFSVISLAFALTALFFVRKIYLKGFQCVFSKNGDLKNKELYKSMMQSILISLIPAAVMLIPIGKNKMVLDLFGDYLWKNNILIGAFCTFAVGFILLVALWYSKQKNEQKHRNSSKTDVLRMSLYQIVSFIFPGASHVSLSASSLIVSGVDDSVVMREVFIYITPSMLVVSVARIIKSLLSGPVIDPVMLALCAVFSLIGTAVMLHFVSKINIKKSLLFFSVYGVIAGIFMLVCSLFVL